MGFVPAATIFMPSAMMAALRMVAVVVPSPAVSFVFEAACARAQAPSSTPHQGLLVDTHWLCWKMQRCKA